MNLEKFEEDLNFLVKKLTNNSDSSAEKKIMELRDRLIYLYKHNLVKINHSVMELVCAKYLILANYDVDVERILNNISCDVYAEKGLGTLIVEVETGFVPPEHALDPLTYCKARIASKITRYSRYSDKFILATPPHYIMPIHPALIKPPRYRRREEIDEIKSLCDLYYSNPPVSSDEIRNAHLHAIYILDVDKATVKETDPSSYVERFIQQM